MKAQHLIDQTKQLIAIRSTADNPAGLKQAVDFVAEIVAKTPGITIERFERNGRPSFLAYKGTVRPEQFDVLLNGHVDVVPAQDEQFTAYEKDGKLYGRGALDMKGTALTLTDVFCELANKVNYALGLQIVCDEEVGGYDGVRLQIDDGVTAKFVVMGEYANDRHVIYNAARGICWAEIAFSGKTAHGGHLWHGTNAVVKAGEFAGAVLKRYPTPDKETWTTTASIANLSTPNDTYNKVPDTAILKIDFRFTQEDPVFQSRESIEAFITNLDPDARLVNLVTYEPAVNVEVLNPYVQGMSHAMKKVTGKNPRFLGRPAGSDGRHYALINNDIVEFGLNGKGSHSDHEYVELESFAEYQAIMRAFLSKPIPDKLQANDEQKAPLHEQLLRTLVGMRTFSKDLDANAKLMAYVDGFLTARGMSVERIVHNGVHNLVATTKRGSKHPTVLLNAHTDTVPAPDKLLDLKLKDGKFYGRGVMDMKHAIAAYLTVVDRLKDELADYDFGIMLTSDEEVGSNDGVKPLVREMGYGADVVIVPDGGNNWQLVEFAKGVKWIKLEASGKTAHASRPWEGESAIHRLLGAIRDIEKLVPKNPKPTDTLLSVGTIQGGEAANQISTSASAILDVRTGSVADHTRVTKGIKRICETHGVQATFSADEPPLVTDYKNPFVKSMLDIVQGVTGQTHKAGYDFAVSDGRIFGEKDIPAIVMNPECGNIHREDEWLSQKSFAQFCDVIERYVREVAVTPTTQADIADLAKRLSGNGKPAYVWYATYGSGLPKENFLLQVSGGSPEGGMVHYKGCTDKTLPVRDMFMSLPYHVYFAGECKPWGGGGHINIEPEPSSSAHTIAHAYLITIDQFEEMTAQQNERDGRSTLPLKEAMQHGHATIGDGSGHYDELVFCGTKDDIPMFTLTAVKPELPYLPPSPIYTKLLCKGLSEYIAMDKQDAIDYVLQQPGIAGHYAEKDIVEYFSESPSK